MLDGVNSPGFGIPLAFDTIGRELGGDFAAVLGSGILDPPAVGTFDSGVALDNVEGSVGVRDEFPGGPSGSVALDPPTVESFDCGVLIPEDADGDLAKDGMRLTPMGMPLPCEEEDALGILL